MALSETAGNVIREEEVRGDVMANRVRYLLGVTFILPAMATTYGNLKWFLFNTGVTVFYLAFTGLHTWVLSRKDRRLADRLSSVTFVADFALFAGILVFYYLAVSPDNAAFLVKNPSVYNFLMPLAFVALQFRSRLLVWATGFTLLAYLAVLGYGILSGMPLTRDWRVGILGDGVILGEKLSLVPIQFLAVALVFYVMIHRTKRMVARVGELEASKVSLSRYFSPAVVAEITKDPDRVSRGVKQKVTILFSDIRGFTAITEGSEPEIMVARLSRYREAMVREIFRHGGTLDKFVGDAVMATFGTPTPSPIPGEDSRRAYACARAMLRSLEDWNRKEGLTGEASWRMGIGLHTGMVIAGNVGESLSLEYTVMGDAVNTASRIESLCKTYGARLLFSSAVRDELDGPALTGDPDFPVTEVGEVEVRGKTEKVRVFRAG